MEIIIMAKSFDEPRQTHNHEEARRLARAASVVVPDALAQHPLVNAKPAATAQVSGQQRRDGQHDHPGAVIGSDSTFCPDSLGQWPRVSSLDCKGFPHSGSAFSGSDLARLWDSLGQWNRSNRETSGRDRLSPREWINRSDARSCEKPLDRAGLSDGLGPSIFHRTAGRRSNRMESSNRVCSWRASTLFRASGDRFWM